MADRLEDILDDLGNSGNGEKTSVGEMLDAFKNRSLGVLLTLLGALAAIPVIGGLPGAPLVLCVLIFVAIGQSIFAYGGLWAPERIRRVEINSAKLAKGIDRAKPWARRIDGLVKNRLAWLAEGKIATTAIVTSATILALSFLPLSFVPWGVGAPALAITAFGLALLGKDGLFALFGYAFVAATLYVALVFLPGFWFIPEIWATGE